MALSEEEKQKIKEQEEYRASVASKHGTKSRIVAILLAFFLGLLGIHQFYLGNNGRGILYLVLTITVLGSFISLILTLIDFFVLLFMSDRKFQEKYSY